MSAEIQPEILDGVAAIDALRLRLAVQLAPRRWRGSLETLARAIDGGQSLEVAFERQRSSVPRELGSLIAEALSVPEPTRLILEAVRIRRTIGRDWYQLVQAMIYPVILCGLALVVGGAFSFIVTDLQKSWIGSNYELFGLAGGDRIEAFANDQQQSIIGLALASGWTLLVLLTIALVGPRWALGAVLGGVMLIGRPLRWIALRELVQRYGLFIAQGQSPVVASEAVVQTFRHSYQAVASAAIAQRIQAGIPLGQALSASLLSDGLTRPALRLIDLRGSELPQALSETGELLGRLTRQRCSGLSTVLPLFAILYVGTLVWAALSVYLLLFQTMVTFLNLLA